MADRSKIKLAAQEEEIALSKMQLGAVRLKLQEVQQALSDAIDRERENKLIVAHFKNAENRALLQKL